MKLLRSVSFLTLAFVAVSANAALFDFESVAVGTYTSISTTSGGLTLDLFRTGGAQFSVSDLSPFSPAIVPASYGTRTLDPFVNPGTNGFVGNLSGLATSLSLEFGDAGQDGDTLTLNIYSGLNGTGTLLGTITGVRLPGEGFGGTLSLSSSAFQSFTLVGTSTAAGFENSVYIDNISVSSAAVPGPAAALPFALMALRRRKRA